MKYFYFLGKIGRWSIFYTMLIASIGFSNTGAAETQESILLLKIYSARVLGPHLTMGYGKDSMRTLARRINPNDVPTLIKMFGEPERENSSGGIAFAIASQCEFGLVGLKQMADAVDTKNRLNPQDRAAHLPYDMGLAVSTIVGFDGCDAATKSAAQAFNTELELRRKAAAQKARDKALSERKVQEQKNRDLLESYNNNTVNKTELDLRVKAAAQRSRDRAPSEREVQEQKNKELLESYFNGTTPTLPRPRNLTPSKDQ
ncbi:MAG: hypothetical protein V4614_09320 [Pseudomonadota bacterium]